MLARLCAVFVAFLGIAAPAAGQDGRPTNTRFVIINNTGFSNSEIFVKFLGSPINRTATPQTYSNAKLLNVGSATASTSYSLQDMQGLLPNSPYQKKVIPTFTLNSYSGGRIYFSFGNKLQAGTSTNPIPSAGNSQDPDYETLYQYVEPFVSGASGGVNNMDLSYVDFVGVPIDLAVRTKTGAIYPYPNGVNPQITQPGRAMVNALLKTDVPQAAFIRDESKKVVRVVSPSIDPDGYHTWDSLLAYLKTTWVDGGGKMRVASYRTKNATNGIPATTLFGYSGRLDAPPDAYSQAFWPGQDYDFNAVYVSNMNPGGANKRINIPNGTPGIVMTGTGVPFQQGGSSAGAFTIYIKYKDLAARTGIWGNNPPYVIDWTSKPGGAQAYPTVGIQNDLTGRVVGDLLAGMLFGWAGNTTNIASHATSSQTQVPAELTASRVGDLSTGEYFFVLSAQPDAASLAQWWGDGISNNPKFYSSYGTALTELTTAYTSAFGDRLQGPLSPSLYWNVNDIASQGLYVEITLNRGAYDTGLVRPFDRVDFLGLGETIAGSDLYGFLASESEKFTEYVNLNRPQSWK